MRNPAGGPPLSRISTGTSLVEARSNARRSCEGAARRKVTPGGRFTFSLERVKVRSPGAVTGDMSSRMAVSDRLVGESFPDGPRNSTRTEAGRSVVNSRSAGSPSKYTGTAREVTSSGSPSTAYHSRIAARRENSFHHKLCVTRGQFMRDRSRFCLLPFWFGNVAVYRATNVGETGEALADAFDGHVALQFAA